MRILNTHKYTTPMPTATRTGRPTRQPTNLTIDSALLAEAKSLGINIFRTCEAHLQEVVRQEKARLWKERHAKFIDRYNAVVETDGLPLDQWRQF